MSVDEKRQRADALRREIEERKAALSVATTEANDAVREARLDREIDRLEAELAAFNAVPEPTVELTEPETRTSVDVRLTGEVRKDELQEMAASLGLDVKGKTKDELIDAIREATGVTTEEG